MLKKIRFIWCLVMFCLAVSAKADDVVVTSADARVWANDKGQELIQTLGMTDPISKFAKLDKMMLEDVNLDYVSKFVIGKYARLMNPEQKKKYHDLFKRYVLSLYKQTSFEFDASRVDFSIQSITEYEKFTTVSCMVDPGNISKNVKIEKIPVKFKLIRGADNRIQAVDVEISDVSMVIEYRKRFYQMIQSDGGHIDWFLEKFEDKVKANEAAIYKKVSL